MDKEGDDRFSEHTPCYLRPGRQETRGHKYSLKLLRRLSRVLRAFGQPFRNMSQHDPTMLGYVALKCYNRLAGALFTFSPPTLPLTENVKLGIIRD